MIEWNKVTWYSKLLAAIFFIFVVPVITFYVGREYEQTKKDLNFYKSMEEPIDHDSISSLSEAKTNLVTSVVPSSGVYGTMLVGGSSFAGHIVVRSTKGEMITISKMRSDGHFLFLLSPGSYLISLLSQKQPPEHMITVKKDSFSKVTVAL